MINLLEVILLTQDAWKAVTTQMIVNCWKHTQILPSDEHLQSIPSFTALPSVILHKPTHNTTAWDIILSFAQGLVLSLPVVEQQLKAELKDSYRFSDWKPSFDAIFKAENNVEAAITAIQKLRDQACSDLHLPSSTVSVLPRPILPQLEKLEAELVDVVDDLIERKQIRRTAALSLEEMLNPIEETIVGTEDFAYPGGDVEIIAEVQEEMAPSQADLDDEEPEEAVKDDSIPLSEADKICIMMEKLTLQLSMAEGLDPILLQEQLRHLRRHIHRTMAVNKAQTTLDSFFNL